MSSRVGVEANSMTGVLVRKGRLGLGHRQGRKHHEAVEAVIRVKHPRMLQSRPHQGSLVASRGQERGLAQIPSGPPEGTNTPATLVPDFLGPGLWGNTFLLVSAIQFVVIYYGSSRKWIRLTNLSFSWSWPMLKVWYSAMPFMCSETGWVSSRACVYLACGTASPDLSPWKACSLAFLRDSKPPTYEPSSYELSKMRTCIHMSSHVG